MLYRQTLLGHRVIIHAGAVIGSDGFGYVLDEGRHRKVLQLGNVIIHDDVEIGANAAIDRGTLGSTRLTPTVLARMCSALMPPCRHAISSTEEEA